MAFIIVGERCKESDTSAIVRFSINCKILQEKMQDRWTIGLNFPGKSGLRDVKEQILSGIGEDPD